MEGNELSKYHLEAAIAYWHTTDSKEKWNRILELYNQLVLIEYSPGTALSRAFALSKVMGKEKAIGEVEKLKLEDSYHNHALLGYLYAEIDRVKAVRCYGKAIELTASEAERRVLTREVHRLMNE
jgi:RNA polymerase sigma-70 factor (ECF subfamily)